MTREQLVAFCTVSARFADPLLEAMGKAEINTPLREAHFLAQVAHESGAFTRVTENLNYSAAGLLATFPKYFPDNQTAIAYARQPERIANKVYANRMGNGDEPSGDGWKYSGKGLIQLTGKDNTRRCSMALYGDDRLVRDPGLLILADGAARSACWFWISRDCSSPADADDIMAVTKKINGGTIGLDDRKRWLEKAKFQLGI